MKNRILRSMLLIAYIGFALSGQLGTLQSNVSPSAVANAATGYVQLGK
ncbi:hypothetical protein [Propionivibrio dicarboxylicus]|uniref:Uncharacterized protein n=1 Tax=Propionivibrio dicarboxylicus TaxID=83767 RepID=A0A1G7YCX5_9RHOO|nr:hypothetical protein [Propionivibrio dicarboxylicus]SDG94187.1 hypothetical protein SAMN05660652_00964 [Propionivibrio dicarboxylicus]